MSGGQRNNNSNSNKHSLHIQREEEENASFKLKPGIKYMVLTALFWSIFSHLLIVVGIWDYVGGGNTADTVVTTVSLLLPACVIGFILALEL